MKSTCMTGRRNGKGFGGAETADAAADGSRTIPLLDYERFNRNNFSIRFRSWYYRGCWHQTCPPIDPRYEGFDLRSFRSRILFGEVRVVIYRHYLPVPGVGNFRACCLPWMW